MPLHHASIIFAPISAFQSAIREVKEKFKKEGLIDTMYQNSDLLVVSFVSLGVEEASQITNFNSRRAIGRNKIMIVSAESMTVPAQNALLKVIEEPAPKTFFFFIVPSKSQILPTLLSRFNEINIHSIDVAIDAPNTENNNEKKHSENPALNVLNFIKQPVSNRMEIIKEILVFLDDEKISRGQICEFISEVIKTRHNMRMKNGGSKNALVASRNKTNMSGSSSPSLTTAALNKSQLKAQIAIEHFMRDTSSSMKMGLEYLALNI